MSEPLDRPLKVCHLGKFYPPAPGGIETHVRVLAQAQVARGMDVSVACVNHADETGNDVTWSRRGVTRTVEHVDEAGVRVCRLGRRLHVAKLDLLPGARQFFRRLKHDPVDILHLHTPNPTMLLAIAAFRPRVPLVITHHSDVVKQRKLYWAFSPFERAVYNRAVSIISNSPTYAGGSTRLLQQHDKVQTLPMGLDLRPFTSPSPAALEHAANARARYGVQGPLWLAVGRCVYYKGFDVAVRALRHVPGTLVIVGQGPYRERLAAIASEHGVADRIVWKGYVPADELVGLYHAATAFWLPSNARSEAFGLVQVEAMASGCPVINADIPHSGVPWVSQHERTGLTVAPNDADGFAGAANRLLAEPGLRDRLSEAARRRAVARFADTTMAARTHKLYSHVLASASNAADAGALSSILSVAQTVPAAGSKDGSGGPLRGDDEDVELALSGG